MRIAIITESFPPDVNGVAHCVVRVAENLVRQAGLTGSYVKAATRNPRTNPTTRLVLALTFQRTRSAVSSTRSIVVRIA